jgi:hypothetical protein
VLHRTLTEDYSATFTISQFAGDDQALVTARFTDARGFDAGLEDGAAVSVGQFDLSPTETRGLYVVAVPAADVYTVTVSDPTRGVQTTEITRPNDFSIIEPADGESASLSGFTLRWTGVDSSLEVSITLAEQIFGENKSREFDPKPDTGSHEFSVDDLSIFQQGAILQITVTKSRQRDDIHGFGASVYSSELTQTGIAEPSP